jgi:nucleotide-binding universal stress UspA family protein
MFEHLLVPLDGSRLAEAALPAAATLARRLGSRVTLVHIVEPDAPQKIHGERHLSDPAEASAYLHEVAARAFSPGVPVEACVHDAGEGVAPSIVACASQWEAGLVVMCTHGEGGLRTWLLGSIAQQVLSFGATPVLLIQPDGAAATPAFACRRLLVPLDGQAGHEQGLAVAAALARACAAELHLLLVVPTLATLPGEHGAAARLLPATTRNLLDLQEEEAWAHLVREAEGLQASGLHAAAEVCRGDPPGAIARAAESARADLVVMGTHGKKGMDAFWSGSIAAQVARHSRVPLLLVPVGEAAVEDEEDVQASEARSNAP